MNLTPNATTTHWAAQYVGRAWEPSFNCWDLVQAIQKEHFKREMADLNISDLEPTPENWQAVRGMMAGGVWSQVPGVELDRIGAEGDVLLMRGPDGPHVGVVLFSGAAGCLIHNLGGLVAEQATGSVRIDPLRNLHRLGYGKFEVWRARA